MSRARRGRRHLRTVRLRQEHLHQNAERPRNDRRRRDHDRRLSARAWRHQREGAAPFSRHGIQHFELFPHLTALGNVMLAQTKVLKRPKPLPKRRRVRCSLASGSATTSSSTPRSFPAASSSALQSRGRWRSIPR